MTITPITPTPAEKLVARSTWLALDFDEQPEHVEVDGVVAYDLGSWLNGWSGDQIDYGSKHRLILDAPAEFTIGHVVEVSASSATDSITFEFEVGTRQVTTTNDTWAPRIVNAGGTSWLAFVQEPGSLKMAKTDPLQVPAKVVSAEILDVGYDVATNKIVVVYVLHGKVYKVIGDPTDNASTLFEPDHLRDEVKAGGLGEKLSATGVQTASFPPIKVPILETAHVPALGEKLSATGVSENSFPPSKQSISQLVPVPELGEKLSATGVSFSLTRGGYEQTPGVLTGYYEDGGPITIRVPRVEKVKPLTAYEPEQPLFYGYEILKGFDGLEPHPIGFIVWPEVDPDFVDFVDDFTGSWDVAKEFVYYLRGYYYKHEGSREIVRSSQIGAGDRVPRLADVVRVPSLGNSSSFSVQLTGYDPIGVG